MAFYYGPNVFQVVRHVYSINFGGDTADFETHYRGITALICAFFSIPIVIAVLEIVWIGHKHSVLDYVPVFICITLSVVKSR